MTKLTFDTATDVQRAEALNMVIAKFVQVVAGSSELAARDDAEKFVQVVKDLNNVIALRLTSTTALLAVLGEIMERIEAIDEMFVDFDAEPKDYLFAYEMLNTSGLEDAIERELDGTAEESYELFERHAS